ncbi:NAD(P)/FAD-dependent oxidoreductase [Arthrobacter echini]|uniref:NAD(P)/FAD-dependent oxidoreductase n=1 Tax=Arthrobacter echini TaxID=1529066 RepID=A0A5D0XL48_9MICC|nr:NAD(P)/FAD-dependent oxidoreductase [Arthrobacter echini]TYC97150.1 NAD(P)/FAD-dependent oxidoreductase [Arthrobacter echini]
MTDIYDALVIGAGMAGVAAATKTASKGWRVGIVDALPYGGTCALRGCDPKKILRRGAEVVDAARLMAGKGIDTGGLSINWEDLMKHKHGFTDPVPESMEQDLKAHGVETLHGVATFTGPTQVDVGGTPYEAAKILIATGAVPRPLGFPGHEHVIDSSEFLNLEVLPPRIVFIGGGFISFEFAHIAARAGSAPIILDRGERPLKSFDADLVELLINRGSDAGVEVRRLTSVTAITKSSSGYTLHTDIPGTSDTSGARQTLQADLVVHGAGRVAELSRLNLEAGQIDHGHHGVKVSGHLQSLTNPAVYAAGDAADTAGLPLTPVAVIEAKVAASNMLKSATSVPDYAATPTAVFTVPELVRVGMLEHEANDSGLNIDVRYTDTSQWYSNYRLGETAGAAKILVDRDTDLIVGAHLFGHGYAELANTISLAMKHRLTTRQLKSTTAVYPSTGSDLSSML